MNPLKRMIGRIFCPKAIEFSDVLKNSFLLSVKETSNFNAPTKKLAQTWLAVCPYTYFTELFIEKVNWNAPIVRGFINSTMIDAQGCYQLTQAYYLAHLFRILELDKNYEEYSHDIIVQNVANHMKFGREIINYFEDFKKSLDDMSMIEDFSMCYVEKIFQKQYPLKTEFDEIITSIWLSSDTQFGLAVFTTESLKRAKDIDRLDLS